ncbi:MAG: hypothetical protein D6719_13170 [Candidatus Dadabacteria bacterium]|nr:MAG: hypothetical protein D6719_13170 [Candidatus Dadabacteria bacterium]
MQIVNDHTGDLQNFGNNQSGVEHHSGKTDILPALPELGPSWEREWITSRAELKKIVPILQSQNFIAIDTETGGYAELNEPLNERLCLIQIGLAKTPQANDPLKQQGKVYLIDVKKLEKEAADESRNAGHEINPLEPLRNVLEDSGVIKAAHNASFEENQFQKYGIALNGAVDTLELARKLRPDLPSHSFKACFAEIIGFQINKGEQTSNWLKDILSTSQEDYAAFDAEGEFKLANVLIGMIEKAAVPASLTTEELLSELKESVVHSLEILENGGLGVKLAKHSARIKELEATVATLVAAAFQDPERRLFYKGENGSVLLKADRLTEIDPEKLLRLHPEIGSKVIEFALSKTELKKHLSQKAKSDAGYNKKMIEEDLASIFVESGIAAPWIGRINLNLEERYGSGYSDTEQVLKAVDRSALEIHQDHLKATLKIAAELFPDLPDHSLVACCREIAGVKLRGIHRGAKASRQQKIFNAEAINALYRTLGSIVEYTSENPVTNVERLAAKIAKAAKKGTLFLKDRPDNSRRSKLEKELHTALDTLLHEIIAERAKIIELMRNNDAGNDLGVEQLRQKHIKAQLKEKLASKLNKSRKSFTFVTDSGEVQIRSRSITRLNLEELKKRHPELVEPLIKVKVSQEKLKEAFAEKGLSNTEQQNLVEKLKTERGRKKPVLRIWPAFGKLYQ